VPAAAGGARSGLAGARARARARRHLAASRACVDGARTPQPGVEGGPTGAGGPRGAWARGAPPLAVPGARHRRWGPGSGTRGAAGAGRPPRPGRGGRDRLQAGPDDGAGRVAPPPRTRTRLTAAGAPRRAAARHRQAGRCHGATGPAAGAGAARGLGGGWAGLASGREALRAGGERPRGRPAAARRAVLVGGHGAARWPSHGAGPTRRGTPAAARRLWEPRPAPAAGCADTAPGGAVACPPDRGRLGTRVARCVHALVVYERPETTGARGRRQACTATGRARARAVGAMVCAVAECL
jgi:hypothetical protein